VFKDQMAKQEADDRWQMAKPKDQRPKTKNLKRNHFTTSLELASRL
jgi:hypothetical protein